MKNTEWRINKQGEKIMKLNKRILSTKIGEVMKDLKIDPSIVKIELKEYKPNKKEEEKSYGYMYPNEDGTYHIVVFVNVHKNNKHIMYTVAHELRHVWQYEQGHSPNGKHDVYDETYEYNVFEKDANRYADRVILNKSFVKNKYGMYFSDIELAEYAAHAYVANKNKELSEYVAEYAYVANFM